MKNERLMEKKLSRMSWNFVGGVFRGDIEVTRAPFGEFYVGLETQPNTGRTIVTFENRKYELFKERIESEDLEGAKSEIKRYFERIEEVSGKIGEEVETKAKEAYQSVINAEIAKRFASDRICGDMLKNLNEYVRINKREEEKCQDSE